MENFFRNIDKLSSKINLKYKGKDGYKNIMGGILTLIVYSITISFSIFSFINLLNRSDPKSYTVKKFLTKGGAVMDQNNLFHWIRLVDYGSLSLVDFDSYKDFFEVNGYFGSIENPNMIKYSYEKCLDEDFSTVNSFYNETNKNSFYCIREMNDLRSNSEGNNVNNKTFEWKSTFLEIKKSNNKNETVSSYIRNPEFFYPCLTIEKPEEQRKIKFFRINISTCKNSSENNFFCKPKEVIDKKLENMTIVIKFIDNMFDVGNYKEPMTRYVNRKNQVIKKNTLSNLYLNFQSVSLKTRDGFIFDSSSNLESYAFDFHSEAFTASDSSLVHQTGFYISADSQEYERSYPKLNNVAAEIAGLYRLFLIAGWIINLFIEKYSNFMIDDDLFDLLDINFDDKALGKRDGIIRLNVNNKGNIDNKNKRNVDNNKWNKDNNHIDDNIDNNILNKDNNNKRKIDDNHIINKWNQGNIDNNFEVGQNNLFEFSKDMNKGDSKFLKNNLISIENKNINKKIKNEIYLNNKKIVANSNIKLNIPNNQNTEYPINLMEQTKKLFIARQSETPIIQEDDDPKIITRKPAYTSNEAIKADKQEKKSNISRKNTIIDVNNNNNNINNEANSSFMNNNNSINLLDKKEEIKKIKLNEQSNAKRENNSNSNKNANEGELNFSLSDINQKAKLLFKKRFQFSGLFCYFFKICLSKKLTYAQRIRNILLDEINIYRLHINFLKLRKILKEELSINMNLGCVRIDLKDIYKNY